MRHIFPSNEIPHLWFHRTQPAAHNSNGSLYFENETIFSYGSHFPIARHVQSKRGKKSAVLFTTGHYSVTTSAHCSHVRSAIPQNVQVFHVPNVIVSADHAANFRHEENIADYRRRIDSAIVASARGRSSWKKESNHADAVKLVAEVKAYAAFFSLKCPKLPVVPALDSKEMKEVKAHEAKNAAKRAEQTRLERIEQEKKDAEYLEKWRNGEIQGGLYRGSIALRITDGEVETSRGARVPVSHALRGLRFVRAVVAKGEPYQRNGHTLHLGNYPIDRIDADGTLHAGCHVIPYAEIARIAPILESMTVSEMEA